MTDTDNLPTRVEDAPPTARMSDKQARVRLAFLCERHAQDKQSSLDLLERMERALWTCAVAASNGSAALARAGYEAGVMDACKGMADLTGGNPDA